MTAAEDIVPRGDRRAWLATVALAVVGPALYGGGLWAFRLADGGPLGETLCFQPGLPAQPTPLRVLAAAVAATGAAMLLWATPWLAGTLALLRIPGCRRAAHAWSLALNSAALALICCLLRSSVGVGRESFLIAWLVWTAVLLLMARRSPPGGVDLRAAIRRLGPATVVALLAVAAGILLFHREHFLQCFNGDGTEFHNLACSLRLHVVPYWEIEPSDRIGVFVANPTIINSYWTLALQLLLGGDELATRLPYWAWQLAAMLLCCRMVQEGDGRGRWLPPAALAVLVLLTTLWHTFYVGYDPYMADLANPGVPDMMFTLLILLALDCLRRGDAAGWGAMAVCASLLFYAGVVMLALMTAAALVWRPLPRRNVLIAAAGAFAAVAIVAGFYLLWGWRTTASTPGGNPSKSNGSASISPLCPAERRACCMPATCCSAAAGSRRWASFCRFCRERGLPIPRPPGTARSRRRRWSICF